MKCSFLLAFSFSLCKVNWKQTETAKWTGKWTENFRFISREFSLLYRTSPLLPKWTGTNEPVSGSQLWIFDCNYRKWQDGQTFSQEGASGDATAAKSERALRPPPPHANLFRNASHGMPLKHSLSTVVPLATHVSNISPHFSPSWRFNKNEKEEGLSWSCQSSGV